MRKFWSYGSPDKEQHYYVPRQNLIDEALLKVVGENPGKGGHYITVWAPRQRGKSWAMQQVIYTVRGGELGQKIDVVKLNLAHLKYTPETNRVVRLIAGMLSEALGLPPVSVERVDEFYQVFKRGVL